MYHLSLSNVSNPLGLSNSYQSESRPSLSINPIESYYNLSASSVNNQVVFNQSSYSFEFYSSLSKSNPSSYNSSLYTNCILYNNTSNIDEYIDTTSDTEDLEVDISILYSSNLPLFFEYNNLVKIPKKIVYALNHNYIPSNLLYAIHPDKSIAIELCLLFLSQLTSTYFDIKEDKKNKGWKSLHAKYLEQLVGIDSTCYKRIRTALEHNHTQGQILECDYIKLNGYKNYYYRFGSGYVPKGIQTYKVKTTVVQKALKQHYMRMLARATNNPICRNLINLYIDIELPTHKQIQLEAKRLIKEGYTNKKGKKLKFLNKHPKSYFKNADQYSFIEDAVEIFDYLTQKNGLMIPNAGGDESGGRVVDSFSLMPSWIRNLVTYKGKHLVECDYSCLHPNIAMNLYGGASEYIKHEEIALALNMSVIDVKREHLSFFNKNVPQMKLSPLYAYYDKYEPILLENIIQEKRNNTTFNKTVDKHKITSRRMFKKEVEIMTQAIEELNQLGVFVMYVYDALYCHPNDVKRVTSIMNSVILQHGVKTHIKPQQ